VFELGAFDATLTPPWWRRVFLQSLVRTRGTFLFTQSLRMLYTRAGNLSYDVKHRKEGRAFNAIDLGPGRGPLRYPVGAVTGDLAWAHDLCAPQLELVRRGRRTDRHDPQHSPYQTNFLVIDEHCGTHFDAPTHFVPPEGSGLPLAGPLGAETSDRVPPEDLMGPAVVMDMRFLAEDGKPGVSPFITDEHVRAWEGEHGRLNEGEVVLFRTGWDRHYVEGEEGLRYMDGSLVTGDAPGWPAPTTEAILYLHERDVRTVGIDAPSIGSAHDPVPVHQEGLSRGIRCVEVLTNLGELPARGATSCSCRSRSLAPPAVRGGRSPCCRDKSINEEDDGFERKRRTVE
jgi:kynurenine formamidase